MTAYTIHLTDAQRDTFEACGIIVLDGEPPKPTHCEATFDDSYTTKYRCRLPLPHDPPHNSLGTYPVRWRDGDNGWGYADTDNSGPLVTPEGWRILTEPCDTCGGDGFTVEGPNYHDPYGDKIECLDCDRGRRVVTLTATCTHADRDVIGRMGHLLCTRCKAESNPDTGYCWRPHPGVVTLGRFTIPALLPCVETVPAVASHDSIEGPVVVFADRQFPRELFIRRDGFIDSLGYPDPLPRPGQFIARPEPVPT